MKEVGLEQRDALARKIYALLGDQPGLVGDILWLGSKPYFLFAANRETRRSNKVSATVSVHLHDAQDIATQLVMDENISILGLPHFLSNLLSVIAMQASMLEQSKGAELTSDVRDLILSIERLLAEIAARRKNYNNLIATTEYLEILATGVANHGLDKFVLVEPPEGPTDP